MKTLMVEWINEYEFFWKMDGDIDGWMDECMEGCIYARVKEFVKLSNRWNSLINGLFISLHMLKE